MGRKQNDMKEFNVTVYPDGTFTDGRCLKSPHADPLDRAEDYERRGLVAMDRGQWRKSDIYFEWARLEREGASNEGL